MRLVNKETLSERDRERKWVSELCLWAVSLRFNICSPHSLPLASGWQQERICGRREVVVVVGGAETWWAEGMAQDHRTHRSFPRHPACQCPFCHFKHNTTDTLSSFTLDCYHGNSLFPAQSLEEDCLSQSSNKPYFRINTHARIIQTIPLCFTTFYFKWVCKTFGVDCTD